MKNSIIIGVFFSFSALASSESVSINWWGLGAKYSETPALGWLIITFILFVAILVKFLKKPLSTYLANRSEEIKKIIEENALEKAKNEEIFKTYEHKIASLYLEIEQMKQEYAEIARKEQEEIIAKAKIIADKMYLDMQASMSANIEKTKNNLISEVMEQAILKACKNISQHQEEFDEAFKNDFINHIGKVKEIANE